MNNLFRHVCLVVLGVVIVSMRSGDFTSASILAAITRPPWIHVLLYNPLYQFITSNVCLINSLINQCFILSSK